MDIELRAAITKAKAVKIPRCGDCYFWMTRRCPKEKHHKPSTNSAGCNKFITMSAQQERQSDEHS